MIQQQGQETQPPKKPKSQKYLPQQQQKQFTIKHVIGRGTFGVVYYAYWNTKNIQVAIKSIAKNPKFKNREVQILSVLEHPCIVDLKMHYEKYDQATKKTYTNIVMDYVPTTLLSLLRSSYSKYNKMDFARTVSYSKKILQALAYLDQKNICHRDIKPSNVLIDQTNNIVKLCDFGSAKQLKKGEKSITYICSRYYRAPELILGCSEYSTKIDIWSAGCVIAQLVTAVPLFDGNNNVDQMAKILKVLGTPTKQDLTNMNIEKESAQLQDVSGIGLSQKIKKANNACPPELINLIQQLIVYDPNKRLSAKQALNHPIFKEEFFPKS